MSECYCIRDFLSDSPFHLGGKHANTKCALNRGDTLSCLEGSLRPRMVQKGLLKNPEAQNLEELGGLAFFESIKQ